MSTGPAPKRLGRLPSPYSADRARRALVFNRAALPAPPAAYDWGAKVKPPWKIYLNDQLGDCAIASLPHMRMAWCASAGRPDPGVTDDQVRSMYFTITGGADSGCNMEAVLDYWAHTGLAGNKILGYAPVDPGNDAQCLTAGWLFGGLYIGVNLPNGSTDGGPWVTPCRGNIGGHAIPVVASGDTVVTWGDTLHMSPSFRQQRCDECYLIYSEEWHGPNGFTPHGFMPSQMGSFLLALGGKLIGILPPDPTPVTPPPPPVPAGPDFSGLI